MYKQMQYFHFFLFKLVNVMQDPVIRTKNHLLIHFNPDQSAQLYVNHMHHQLTELLHRSIFAVPSILPYGGLLFEHNGSNFQIHLLTPIS